jgi:hypothetical protein
MKWKCGDDVDASMEIAIMQHGEAQHKMLGTNER